MIDNPMDSHNEDNEPNGNRSDSSSPNSGEFNVDRSASRSGERSTYVMRSRVNRSGSADGLNSMHNRDEGFTHRRVISSSEFDQEKRDNQGGGDRYNRYDNRGNQGGGGGYNRYDNRGNQGGGGGYNRYDNRGNQGGGGGYNRYDNRGNQGGGGGYNRYDNRGNQGGGGDRYNRYDNRGNQGGGGGYNRYDNRGNQGGGGYNRYDNRGNQGADGPREFNREGRSYGSNNNNRRGPHPGSMRNNNNRFQKHGGKQKFNKHNKKFSKKPFNKFKKKKEEELPVVPLVVAPKINPRFLPPTKPYTLIKALLKLHVASRQFALEAVSNSRVEVNGNVELKQNAMVRIDSDEIKVDGVLLKHNQENVYLVMNKPKKFAGSPEDETRDIMDVLSRRTGWYIPGGPLAQSASGIVIITNDPEQKNSEKNIFTLMEKEYWFKIHKHITKRSLPKLQKALEKIHPDNEGIAKADIAQKNKDDMWLTFTVRQARMNQMCSILKESGLEVLAIERKRIGSITVENIPAGAWRRLKEEEVKGVIAQSVNPLMVDEKEQKESSWLNLFTKWFKPVEEPKAEEPKKEKGTYKGKAKPKREKK